MPNKYAEAQIRVLELLKENNLLDMAVAGTLPPHILKAAKTAVLAEKTGLQRNQDGDGLACTAEEHEEAERELDAYLSHYRLDKALRAAARSYTPRTFRKGAKYAVRRGYFKDHVGVYRGTDMEVWGANWLDCPLNPACEKYIFRAQHDHLNVSNPALVFNLKNEGRDIILQEQEMGLEVV